MAKPTKDLDGNIMCDVSICGAFAIFRISTRGASCHYCHRHLGEATDSLFDLVHTESGRLTRLVSN